MGPSEALAAFASGTTFESLPAGVVKKSKISILDGIGTAALSSTLAKSRQETKAIRALSSGGSVTVWAAGFHASPLEGALLNGMLVEGLDYSDIHVGAGLHPTSVILPAIVACAESRKADGRDILLAHAIGCETMIRLGLSAPGRFHARGFQPTSIIGVLGAALATGKVLELTPAQMTEALSLGSTLAFGSSLSVRVGAYFGWLDSGRAAEGGMLAAFMAEEGVRGIATDAIEGRFGFLDTHAGPGDYDLAPITANLGKKWEMRDIFLKRYPTSYACTPMIDAAIRLKQKEGFDATEIEEVRFGDNAQNIGLFSEPEEAKRRPATIYDAKTSHYFLLSLALMYGAVDASLIVGKLKDQRVLALSDKVGYSLDEKGHWVQVRLKDGRSFFESQDKLEATPESLVRKKFVENASPVYGEKRAERIESLIDSLEDLRGAGELTRLLS